MSGTLAAGIMLETNVCSIINRHRTSRGNELQYFDSLVSTDYKRVSLARTFFVVRVFFTSLLCGRGQLPNTTVLAPFALNAVVTLLSLYGLGISNISVRFLSSRIWLIATTAATVSTLFVALLSWTFTWGMTPCLLRHTGAASPVHFQNTGQRVLNYGTAHNDRDHHAALRRW